MAYSMIIEINREELALRIFEALVAPDQVVRAETAAETISTLQEKQANSILLAADAALIYIFSCLNDGHTRH